MGAINNQSRATKGQTVENLPACEFDMSANIF